MRYKKTSSLALSLEDSMRRDLIFLNNPVLMQGLSLTPAIAATTTLKNAVVLSVAAILLIMPVRLIGDMLYRTIPVRMRMMAYAIFASALFIPVSMLINFMFGADAHGPGIFLPLLVVDGAMLSRAEIPSREGTAYAIRNGLMTSLGITIVLILMGATREFFGAGKIWGVQILSEAPVGVLSTAAGGFIVVAIFSALVQAVANRYKRARLGGGDEQ